MEPIHLRILETLITVVVYVIAFFLTTIIINNSLKKAHLERTRRKMIIKAIHLIILIAVTIIIAGIWGLEQNEIAVFASTLLTALGIGFFAQWSLLSNITSSIILFFNHPLKLGDTIKIMDKDFPVEGEITELTNFFIHIKTNEGQTITIPNTQIFQKSVSIVEKQEEK